MDATQKRANSSAPKSLQIAAAVIGNALEWYDFLVFGFLTVVMMRPKKNGIRQPQPSNSSGVKPRVTKKLMRAPANKARA
jgi:hypothetical protein